jgi:clan AA aspartic protease (TIGR02281 family)
MVPSEATPVRLATRLLLLICATLSADAAVAEVYKWVDANGTIHYSQDRNTLPKASSVPKPDAKPVEVFEFKKPAKEAPPADSYTVYMRAAGTGNHVVQVELNGRITAPMLLDTGASDVVITREVAHRLGLTERDLRGTQTYSTANGLVVQPAITLRKVSLGGATVENVRGSISDSMEVGLLGTSFLGKFEYSIKGSELILVPRD